MILGPKAQQKADVIFDHVIIRYKVVLILCFRSRLYNIRLNICLFLLPPLTLYNPDLGTLASS